jgi:hypothetical protein
MKVSLLQRKRSTGLLLKPTYLVRKRGGVQLSPHVMEVIEIRDGLQLLGDNCWLYANSKGYFSRKLKTSWEEVIMITDQNHLSYQTFHLYLLHYLKFGENPSATKKRDKGCGQSVKDKCCTSSFMDEESKTLLKIIRNNPQLFLDEIQIMML